jgi:hypothetical protein
LPFNDICETMLGDSIGVNIIYYMKEKQEAKVSLIYIYTDLGVVCIMQNIYNKEL